MMGLIEDFNKPLDQVENVILRRTVTIILGIFIFPFLMVYSAAWGIWIGVCIFWKDWILSCW